MLRHSTGEISAWSPAAHEVMPDGWSPLSFIPLSMLAAVTCCSGLCCLIGSFCQTSEADVDGSGTSATSGVTAANKAVQTDGTCHCRSP